MGIGRIRSPEPDLFATAEADESSVPLAKPPQSTINSATPSARYVLPSNLQEIIKRLEDQELDRWLTVVLAEQKRRGRKPPASDKTPNKRRVEALTVPLTTSKINAVRAAFKAGVKPSQIARQFGISQSDVRKALANGS